VISCGCMIVVSFASVQPTDRGTGIVVPWCRGPRRSRPFT
jgi:hypothetical protein